MSHLQFQSKRFILRHAWLNLWDERITTGRINQVAILFFSITSSEVACDKHTSPNTIYAVGYLFSIWEWEHNAVCPVIQKGDVTISWDLPDVKCAKGLSPKTGRKQMITNTFNAFSPVCPHKLRLATTTTPQSVQWIVRGHQLLGLGLVLPLTLFLTPS